MKDNTLNVSETFYSIQGEGQTMGRLAVFLRLAGCNLLCKGDNWVCDTIEVWIKGKSTAFEDVLQPGFIYQLSQGAHLIITGGEPLMQQKNVAAFIKWLKREHKLPNLVVEIETNGTIAPVHLCGLHMLVQYWNVSPKLATSRAGSYAERINEDALRMFENEHFGSVIYKFVISCEDDWLDLVESFEGLISLKKVVLMPAGDSQNQLAKTRPMVAELCKAVGARYSDRLHIGIWNQKTGV